MELLEWHTGDAGTHSTRNATTAVANEVRDAEGLICLLLVSMLNIEVPIVGELQTQSCMIGCFDVDDVAEVGRTEEHVQCLDTSSLLGETLVRLLRIPGRSRKREQRELLIGTQKNSLRAENSALCAFLVVVDLGDGVVRDEVLHDTCLVTPNRTSGGGIHV